MLTPGARAKKFIRPRGSNAIFAAKRGLLAPAPIKESQTTPDQKTPSRFGKAFSMDYTKFFGAKRTTKAMRGAVKAIKDILVETYAAAMSLGATIRNIVKQLAGVGVGRAGGGGLLGKLGIVGLVAAVVAGVAAIFGPKIKEVFDSFKAGANQVFENVKGFLDGIEQKIISIYNFVRDLYNNKFKGLLQTYNNAVQAIADRTGIPLPKINLGAMKDIPAYTDQFPEGLNPLAGKTLDSVMGDVGNMLKGGLENTTGIIGDLFNNMLSGLGLTDTANAITESLGAGSLFGPNRNLGSGAGLSTFFPGLKPKASTKTTSESSSTSRTSGSGDLKTRIRQAESGNDYSSMFARDRGDFSRGQEDISKMTIDQVHDLQTDYLNHQASKGYSSSQRSAAMGAYQMMEVKKVAQMMGIDTSKTKFDQATQDRMADYYLNVAGFQDFKAGKITAEQFNDRLAGQFASLKTTSGAGVYDTDGINSAYDSVLDLLRSGNIQNNNVVPNAPAPAVQPAPNQNQSSVPDKPNQQQVSFLNNIGFTGANQIAAAPRRPSPIITGNGSGTEGSDYSFFPPGNSDLFDVFGSQLGIA